METPDSPWSRLPEDAEELLPKPSVLSFEEYLDMQRAIGHRTRFRLLYSLKTQGDKSAVELANTLDIPSNTLHYHLDMLVDVGLVQRRIRKTADEELLTYYRETDMGETIIDHGVVELMRREWVHLDAYGTSEF